MSEARPMLVETAERLFGNLRGAENAWDAVREAGFEALLLPEDAGGFGGDWGDLFAVSRLAGAHVLNSPLGEGAVAAWAAHASGLDVDGARLTLAPTATGTIAGAWFTGRLAGVPWGRDAAAVVAKLEGDLLVARVADAVVEPAESPAGEPRDTLIFESATVQVAASPVDIFAAGAFIRAAQIAGCLDAALEASITYANERQQFGRPISKFQTVQQSLAIFAVEAAAANSAGQAAARAADAGDAAFEFGAAKLRGNRASGVGAATAHQVHGAMGFTHEHPLHQWTRRLIAWRSEFGGDRYWAGHVGRMVATLGPEGFWPELTRRGDATHEQDQ